MRYYVKVNGNVLEETYPVEDIQGYAPAWREYQAEVEVASDWNGPFMSLARFLGEPEPPAGPPPPPFALPEPGPKPPQEPPPAATGEGFAALQNFQSSAQMAAEAAPPLDPGSQIPYTRNGMARLGVGLALLGLILVVFTKYFGPLLCVAGIVVSFIGLKHVKDEPAIYGGKGLATNGIVTGSIGLVVTLIMLAFPPASMNLPSLSASPGNESDFPIKALLRIERAQRIYEAGMGNGDYANSLADLGKGDLLGPEIAGLESMAQGGFKVVNLETVKKTTTNEARYSLNLVPVKEDGSPRSGDYSYFLDESGVVRRSMKVDELANVSCPPTNVESIRLEEENVDWEKIRREREIEDKKRQESIDNFQRKQGQEEFERRTGKRFN